MKRLCLLFISISLFTACEGDSLNSPVVNNSDNGNSNMSNEPLALSNYNLNVNSIVPVFGTVDVNNDYSFNSSNHVISSAITSTFFGESNTEIVTYQRDNSNRITSLTSTNAGVVTNETIISYNDNTISKIIYNVIENDEDDYTYNFTYAGNMITRTELGSNISTVFTLDSSNNLIRKESFIGAQSIKTEVLDYDGLGNCITSIITGEDATSSNFSFDTNESPLWDAFSDQIMLSFLNDEYSDEAGIFMAQFASPNNWISITKPQDTISFIVEYDTDNRIISRDGNYDLGNGVAIQLSETFSYVN